MPAPRSARKSARRSDSPEERVTRSARKSTRLTESPVQHVELADKPPRSVRKAAAPKATPKKETAPKATPKKAVAAKATPKKTAAPPKSPAVKATLKKTPKKEVSDNESEEEEKPKLAPRRSARKATQLSNEYNEGAFKETTAGLSTPKKETAGEGGWGGADLSSDAGFFWGRDTLGPLFLMIAPPIFIFVLWYLQFHCNGDLMEFYKVVTSDDFTLYGSEKSLIPSPFDPVAWKMIIGYSVFELALMRFMPGEEFRATVTPKGNTPIYTANGFQSFAFTLVVLAGIMCNKQMNPESAYDPSLVYDKFGNMISSLNIFAFGLCFFLTFKGKNFPSTSDSGTTGNSVVDFYWGTELYPRIFGFDVKVFTNCRFGMMYWAVGICCYAYKQFDMNGFVSDSMAISVFLQLIYIAKFFYWETGYFCSMDIQHDRAGYYLCWGCMLWVPAVYASQSFYLVNHPVQLDPWVSAFNVIVGVICIWINYDADRQRQQFRNCQGKCEIWGRSPVMIRAKYTTKDKEERDSLLLASGWWGISRHFHYIPEILSAFFWTVPFACEGHIIPFFYVIYLTILLFDRAFRDDVRCASKYGDYWKEYCGKVPYKIIPGVI